MKVSGIDNVLKLVGKMSQKGDSHNVSGWVRDQRTKVVGINPIRPQVVYPEVVEVCVCVRE